MSKEPIEVFESKEQFKACCKEWQERLFLNNWFIKFNLTTEELKDENGNILWGVCTHMTEGSAAVINSGRKPPSFSYGDISPQAR